MTTAQKLDLILEKLAAFETKLDMVYGAIGTTADHDDLTEVKDTLDYIASQLEEQDRQNTLTEIRQATRRAS